MSLDYATLDLVGKYPTERETMTNSVIAESLEVLASANSKLDSVMPLTNVVSDLMGVANSLTTLGHIDQAIEIMEISNSLLEIINSRLNA